MYLKPFNNFTYLVVSEQDKLSAVKKTKMNSSKADFELFALHHKDNWVFFWTFSFHL